MNKKDSKQYGVSSKQKDNASYQHKQPFYHPERPFARPVRNFILYPLSFNLSNRGHPEPRELTRDKLCEGSKIAE
jgi:hypothetical protein